jgi:dihydroorotate dehydrogenase (fumarate)
MELVTSLCCAPTPDREITAVAMRLNAPDAGDREEARAFWRGWAGSEATLAQWVSLSGAAGVVLFNRFYQPDLDIEELEVKPELKLSDSSELLLRLRWLAILSPHLKGSLASTGGAHTAADAIKAILAGAHAVQMVSVLLKHGPRVLTTILQGMQHWMDEHGYQSVEEFRGAMNLRRCPDAHAFERANYQRILQSWRV